MRTHEMLRMAVVVSADFLAKRDSPLWLLVLLLGNLKKRYQQIDLFEAQKRWPNAFEPVNQTFASHLYCAQREVR